MKKFDEKQSISGKGIFDLQNEEINPYSEEEKKDNFDRNAAKSYLLNLMMDLYGHFNRIGLK
jgi:hypothetical protein